MTCRNKSKKKIKLEESKEGSNNIDALFSSSVFELTAPMYNDKAQAKNRFSRASYHASHISTRNVGTMKNSVLEKNQSTEDMLTGKTTDYHERQQQHKPTPLKRRSTGTGVSSGEEVESMALTNKDSNFFRSKQWFNRRNMKAKVKV